MFCAVSGSVPEEPVVSVKSGHLFEKSLAVKYVQETGKCPATDEPLTLDELIPLKINKTVKPRTAPAASIPGLLGLFHDEWDALMLEVHTLRQNNHKLRQELSHALYQHDAACRVIARLGRERDEALKTLEQAKEHFEREISTKRAVEQAEEKAEEVPAKRPRVEGITEEVLAVMQAYNQKASSARKKRVISPTLATPDEIASFTLSGSHPLHKTTQPGITCLDVNPADENNVATGGVDNNIAVFDLQQQRLLATLEGHTKKVSGLQFADSDTLLSCSADKTCRVWRDKSCVAVLREHDDDVVGITVHPTSKYFISASKDRSWCFYDVETSKCLKQVRDADVAERGEAYTCVQLHPDGLILGTGMDSAAVRIWEVKSCANVATFEGHSGPVRALAFSENGYYLATCASDGVKLWDLRKLRNFRNITPYEDSAVNSVKFDTSGLYLAVGGADARVYSTKNDWPLIKSWGEVPKKGVASLCWGRDAHRLLVGAADHNLRVFGGKPADA